MAFYDLSKEERSKLVSKMYDTILDEFRKGQLNKIIVYFSDEDTYIRKSSYLSTGRIYFSNKDLKNKIIMILDELFNSEIYKIRQTVINAAGEIGKKEFEHVKKIFDKALSDKHHAVRNAVIGSIKKMCEVNPEPVLEWSRTYLHHPDEEIRKEICHGIELRGRKHPSDVLTLLKELENDESRKVRKMLIHVIGQISYKKGCLEIVINEIKKWENRELVEDALNEIIEVFDDYKDFAAMTTDQAKKYIKEHFYN